MASATRAARESAPAARRSVNVVAPATDIVGRADEERRGGGARPEQAVSKMKRRAKAMGAIFGSLKPARCGGPLDLEATKGR